MRLFITRLIPGRKMKFPRIPSFLIYILTFGTLGLVCIGYNIAYSSIHMPLLIKDHFGYQFEHSAQLLVKKELNLIQKPVKELIDAISAATSLAAGGSDAVVLTDEERKEWELANPCRSRLGLTSMYARRKFATDVDQNVVWDMVLQEYSKLHRTCRQRVGNLKEYFLAKNSSVAGCKFAIADYSEGGGLGNKIVALTNTVLYSILTQRVVLVPSASLIPALMCEPFPGSSWLLERAIDGDFPVPPWNPAHQGLWTFHDSVYKELDDAKNRTADDLKTPPSTIYSSSMTFYQYQPDSRFFCNAEQAGFTGVTWLYFTGCLYTIPRFFALPSLRPTLESLFPDRRVLTHLVRSVMLPEDLVWERIVRTDSENMGNADRRIGVQIRYRRNLPEYLQMNDVMNERIMKCAVENGVLPPVVGYNLTANFDSSNAYDRESSTVVKLLIASLFTGFSDMLSQKYLPHRTLTGELVEQVQLSHENAQTYGLDVDRQALLEIMMLSFSDSLYVTPLSTFGGLAQAYGNLVPWILDFRSGDQFGPCERGQTVDLCYQEADFVYSCPHDLSVHGRVISEVVPYIQNCLAVDSQQGIRPGFQLITSTVPSRYS